MSLFVRKDDNVMVVAGKERGKTGKIIKCCRRRAAWSSSG